MAEIDEMRVDKFLKVSRIIKRRTVASDACDTEHIKVNGKVAKPSTRIKAGDILEVTFGQRTLTVRVLTVREHVLKADSADMYEVISQ